MLCHFQTGRVWVIEGIKGVHLFILLPRRQWRYVISCFVSHPDSIKKIMHYCGGCFFNNHAVFQAARTSKTGGEARYAKVCNGLRAVCSAAVFLQPRSTRRWFQCLGISQRNHGGTFRWPSHDCCFWVAFMLVHCGMCSSA